MEPSISIINIAAESYKHLTPRALLKVLTRKEQYLSDALKGFSMVGSGGVLELKTDIAAIKMLLNLKNRKEA